MSRKSIPKSTIATLLAALLSFPGCGKNPTAPADEGISEEQAVVIASRIGDSFRGTSAIEYARQLVSSGGALATSGQSDGRPAHRVVLTEDGSEFRYDIRAFDASGNPVDWGSDRDRIARIELDWNLRWDWRDEDGPSFLKGRAIGRFDLNGLLPSSREVALSGASRDTSEYRWVLPGHEWSGNGITSGGIHDVKWSKDWAAHPYPLAGRQTMFVNQRWTYWMGMERETQHIEAHVDVEYNGTRWAAMTIDGRHRFRLDLDTGEVESHPA